MRLNLKIAVWITVYLGVSFALGQITQGSIDDWYLGLEKPSFNPPNWVFGPVWGILYIMIACTGFYLWRKKAPIDLKIIFILYTLVNWLWTPIFFSAEQIFIGFLWLQLLNVITLTFIYKAWNVAAISARLMILPFAWTLFAMVLNYKIWELNS